MGFVNKTVLINKAEHDLLVIMEEDKQALDEVVVIGYGTAKKKDITGAISSVSADKLKGNSGSQSESGSSRQKCRCTSAVK